MDDRRPRILCIDDDPDVLTSLIEGLSGSGFDVLTASDGPSGLDLFHREGADAILLDLGLPGMDGLAVSRALKSIVTGSTIPVIFLTAQSDLKTKVEALEAGGDDFCTKPFSLEELVARIHVRLRIRDREVQLLSESTRFQGLSLTDTLTGIGNRRAFDIALQREWARTLRSGRPLGLVIVDIDRFKAFNDLHGHKTGDQVLHSVGQGIAAAVRLSDEAFRFGGEEFAVLLPESSPGGILVVAERIRRAIAAKPVGPSKLSVTVSLGVAVAPDPAFATTDAFIESADRALYEAKAAGRNRVVSSWVGVAS